MEKLHSFSVRSMPGRVFTQLLEVAQDQHGYVTPRDARGLNVNPLRLQDLVRQGLAEHVAHGVYRIALVPVTSLDQYMEASLWPQAARGVLCAETALDLHELCDVNPAKIHVAVPAGYRPRRDVPKLYTLHYRDLDDRDVTRHEGIPIVTPYRAILDGIDSHLGPRLLGQAIDNAKARGLLTREQLAAVRRRVKAPAPA
jgi:predicted transcriptional regulator of viral defense system